MPLIIPYGGDLAGRDPVSAAPSLQRELDSFLSFNAAVVAFAYCINIYQA